LFEKDGPPGHSYNAAHRAYNEAVRDVLKLTSEEGQEEVARDVVKSARQILDSENPAIKGFLDNMPTADGMTGREALEKALAGDGEAAGEFINAVVGEVVVDAIKIE
jgi:hypothetical protein